MPKGMPLRDHVLSRLVITEPPLAYDRLGRSIVGPCLIWTGARSAGYGCTYDSRRRGNSFTHRLMMEWFADEITDKTDHLCRVTLCASPAHLEDVSTRENTLRGDGPPAVNASRTNCHAGHPFTAENTRVRPNGSRACRTCARDTAREKYRAAHGIPPSQINKRDRDFCVNGHARTAVNTSVLTVAGNSQNHCRQCDRNSGARYRQRQRQAPRRSSSAPRR